ncbi:MAG: trans-sulfuration enzyme family protein [Myxococcota bacterium]
MTHEPRFRMDTLAIHAGQTPDPTTGAIAPPIVTSSTFAQRAPGEPIGFEYGRGDNPTRGALERCLAELEGGRLGVAFGSGSAAIHAVLSTLAPGEHVVCGNDVYGGTFRLLAHQARSAGLEVTYVDAADAEAVEAALRERTRLVWVETPTNPMLRVMDLAALADVAHRAGALLAVDSTFATPVLLRPLEHGADLVVHSSSKYLGGHSDVIGGVVVTRDEALGERLRYVQKAVGAVPSPFDCYLVLRGLKTLPLRMGRHCENALVVARALEGHPGVERVVYPGLASHPHHERARRLLGASGGVVCFMVPGGVEGAKRTLARLRVFTVAESLGGVESLIGHPASMSHAAMPAERRQALGIEDGFVRASVGVESADDLVADLRAALS